jgi:hypothetical protein
MCPTNGTLTLSARLRPRSWPMLSLDATGKNRRDNPDARDVLQSHDFHPMGPSLHTRSRQAMGSDIFVYEPGAPIHDATHFQSAGKHRAHVDAGWKNIFAYRSIQPPAMWWTRADGGRRGTANFCARHSEEFRLASFSRMERV